MKEHMINQLKKGKRQDGRGLTDVREIKIETGIISTAEGSAKVKFGEAEVYAGVKIAVESPYPDTPDSGVLMVNTELLPLSNPEFEAGPPSIQSIETARVIDRGIRESHAVDTKKLCIEKGKQVWSLAIDVVPINHDGNLIDIGGIAALAALKTARFPTLTEDNVVDYKKITDKKVEMQREPIPVTVCKIGDILIVDPTEEEEKFTDCRVTLTFLEDGRLCSMQKGGESAITQEDFTQMLEIGQKASEQMRKAIKEAI